MYVFISSSPSSSVSDALSMSGIKRDRCQGTVANHQRPNMNDSDGMEVKKGNHAPRYCKTCEHYKPPRGTSMKPPRGKVKS